MKKYILILAAATLMASCGPKTEVNELETNKDTISWVMGRSMAESAVAAGFDIDPEVFMQAVETTLKGGKQLVDDQNYLDMLATLTELAAVNQHEQRKEQLEKAQQEQTVYFEQLAKNPKIKKSTNGLYYEVLQEGNGPKGSLGKIAVFDYRSYTAYDNKPYDQTYGNRESIIHVIGNPMMPAMQEALCEMPAGSIYRFYFPLETLAGVTGVPELSPLVYEIELKEIK